MSERIFDTLLDVIRPNSNRPGGAEASDDLRAAYDPPLERVAQLCGEPSLDDLSHPHLADPFGTTPDEAREQAWAYRTFGVDADAFVRAHDVAVEGVVSATFDRLRAELGDEDALDRAEADLTSALDDVLGSAAAGVDAYGSPRAAADGGTRSGGSVNADLGPDASLPDRGDGGSSADESFPLGFREIMDNVGTALFILDADGNVVFWNRGAEKLTGESRETAYEYEMASRAFYHDGRRAKTLADKVLDAPESADEAYDVPRVDDVEYTLYRDTSTMTASGGEEKHISFSAAPLYRDGELVGVVEMVQDQTEIVERRNKTEDLVMELKGTMDAMQRGETDVRADFDHEGLLDEKMLTVVDSLNEMAEQFAVLAALTDQVAELHTHAEYVAETAQGVNDSALGQTETMEQISSEISNLSATIEEVASSAAQVDATSSQAEELATDGQESAEEAVSLLSDVSSSADDVTSDVAQLQERIDEIDEIITVINDIADQTNILALNASIEAARAGEAGEGFAVVADEVKQLAEESQQNATEIEELINNIQDDTEKTVSNLDETTRRVGEVIEQVEDAMSKLSDITDAITEASEGIQEVADATDDQASSTEEVASIVNQATEEAEEIAEEIEGIVDANQEQMRKTEELRATIDENTYH